MAYDSYSISSAEAGSLLNSSYITGGLGISSSPPKRYGGQFYINEAAHMHSLLCGLPTSTKKKKAGKKMYDQNEGLRMCASLSQTQIRASR